MSAETVSQTPAISYYQQGNQLKEAGKLSEAVTAFQSSIALDPNFCWSHHHLGEALAQLGQMQEAIAHYQRAIELDPTVSWSHHNLAGILAQQEQLEAAITHYQQAIALNPTFSWSHHAVAEFLERQGRLEEAIAHYQHAIELNPSFHGSHRRLKRILISQGRLPEAIEWYRRILEQQPNSSWFHHYLAEGLVELDPNEAIAHYHRATQLNPTFVWSYCYLAEVLIRQERLYEAMRCYDKVIQIQPDLQHIYDNFDNFYYGLKYSYQSLSSSQLDEVISFHQRLVKLQPNHAAAHTSLGDLLFFRNRIDEGLQHYKAASYSKVLQSHPGYLDSNGQSDWQQEEPQKPNFLIIGTMKSGTTSLYQYLTQHPQILPAIKKEINFFDYNFSRGIDWYLAHFPIIAKSQPALTGEASPVYFIASKAIERVASYLPDVKLIVILRDPVERTISHYYHRAKWVFQEKRSLEESIQTEIELLSNLADISMAFEIYPQQQGYVFISLYVYFLAKWMAVFPKEQLLVLRGEDLFEKPVETMQQVFNFLGVPDHQLPHYQNYFPGVHRSVNPEIRQMLSEYFQPHNRRLEEYLGVQFDWK